MKNSVLGAFIAAICLVLVSMPANAQATRTWVSGVGDDANPCSRTAPCKTFAGAISKTAAFGEINCLDPGGFGAVTITKSIALICDSVEGGVLVSGTNGIVVNVASTDVVLLQGLDFEGLTTGLSGVLFLGSGALHAVNCTIRGFNSSSAGFGINFTPNGAGKLFVTDSRISENGSGAGGGGIFVKPTAGGSAQAVITRTTLYNNNIGIRSDGSSSTTGVAVTISDTRVSGNANGGIVVFSQGGSAPTKVWVDRSVSSSNGTGINANGAAATLRIGYSVVTGNATGVTIPNGATATSLGTNQINDNTIPGQTLTVVGPN